MRIVDQDHLVGRWRRQVNAGAEVRNQKKLRDPLFVAERIDALRLAVSEAATNAVESYRGRGDGERIIIRCNLGAEQIAVEVADRGEGFDPDDVAELGEEPLLGREGGFGLPLIRSIADESQILPGPDGTAVRIVVYTHPQDDPS